MHIVAINQGNFAGRRDEMTSTLKSDRNEMTTTIRIIETPLTDGSMAYAVTISERVLDCVTQQDAFELARKFSNAIDAHTNEDVKISNQTHPGYEAA